MSEQVAVAGATGYTGRRILAELLASGRQPIALVRPASPSALPAGVTPTLAAPNDPAALAAAIAGATAVIQTIGTTRAQFGPGVSYETVDYATTVALIAAARQAGVPRMLLLSSAGAGRPLGAYLQWKARTEQAVRASGLAWTILRPAAIVGPGRRLMAAATAPLDWLSQLPLLGGAALGLRSMPVADLARCFVRCLERPATVGRTLEGRSLWELLA